MNTKEYVESLFKNYEESGSLKDFMEELQSNLEARISSLVKNGMPEEKAFEKAKTELGDVSALADELSLKKRREVFEEVYMDIQNYMTKGRLASYIIFGVILLFGIVASVITHFAAGLYFDFELDIAITLSAFMVFFVTSVTGFTYLGLTQETGSSFPVSKKRAVWYSLAAAFISFGLLLIPIVYFLTKFSGLLQPFQILTALSVLIPFVLPGTGLLVYMILSEKNRLKPWAATQHEEMIRQSMDMWNGDQQGAARFGIFSGAIWTFAIAIFILLGFLIGFKFSWLVFLFATAIQLLVQGLMTTKKQN